MKLRPHEEAALAEAVPAWKKTWDAIYRPHRATGKQKGRTGDRCKVKHETPDQILARHGIVHRNSFTGDYLRYGIVEAELRRRARED